MMHNVSIKSEADKFLQLIRRSRKGYLKIYIGLAAGVGKTYRMLLDAHNLMGHGVDLAIGLIEAHGRPETEKLTYTLPAIPRKKIFYKGFEFEELDVEAIIRRHPEVVLIDELAHTNITGSRNNKRYQDLEEILDSGINVLSTLNIQHIESLNSLIFQITGVEVSERIPDYVLMLADEVVNVDLPVDELLERLNDGKIYDVVKVKQALNGFFKRENLLQLREIALREVANVIEKRIDSEFKNVVKSNQRILACISSDYKKANHLIHKCARLSQKIDAEWFVLYIQTGKESENNIDLSLQRRLINNFQKATELGAQVFKKEGTSIAKEIVGFAAEKKITLILLGRSDKSLFYKIVDGDIVRKVTSLVKNMNIDLQIVS